MKKIKSVNMSLTINDAMKYPNAGIKNEICTYQSIIALICNEPYQTGINNNLANCKLQLRPLSSLTEQENENAKVNYWDKSSIAGINLIDYLRSINIDIDGFEKEGKATYE